VTSRNILLITDYRNQFYESVRSHGASLDLARMGKYFSNMGYHLDVVHFHDVDLRNGDYAGCPILYQSSEDRGLLYKDYIEDILLGLTLRGARLIPDFTKFRAHHNKVFMEILRDISDCAAVKGISSRYYGSLEEFVGDAQKQPEQLVMKPASGARSSGVRLVEGRKAQLRYARRLSSSFHPIDYAKVVGNSIIRKDYPKKSVHRRKFIAQEYLPGLTGDYKVLVYGDKYYLLQRLNRENDFRASGSGRFSFPGSPPEGILDFAANVFNSFAVPFISMDIAEHEGHYVLIEFQFLSFGNYTLERSSFYFTNTDKSGWAKIEETPDLEREFAASIVRYLDLYPEG